MAIYRGSGTPGTGSLLEVSHEGLASLQGGQTGQHYHLTAAEHTLLTGYVSGGIDHNTDTSGHQGGSASERYHLSLAEYNQVQANDHEALSGLLGGAAGDHQHLTTALLTQVQNNDHNTTTGKQGGTAGEYYHHTAAEYTEAQAIYGLTTLDPTNTSMYYGSGPTAVGGTQNTAYGYGAGDALLASSRWNTIVGGRSGKVYIGDKSTMFGADAGYRAIGGEQLTLYGYLAGAYITSASFCTFFGSGAGGTHQTGDNCSAFGWGASVDEGVSASDVLGNGALVTSNNTTVVGRTTNTVVIGATADDASGHKLQVTGTIGQSGNSVLDAGDIGVSVQGYDADLADIAALTPVEGDYLAYDGSQWNRSNLVGAIGNLSTPMVDLLRVNRLQGEHVGTLTVTSPAGTMYPDRYGVLQASSSGVGRFGKDGFICSPGATNSALHSEDLTNAVYTKSAGLTLGTPVSAAGLSLDLAGDATASSEFVLQNITIPATTTDVHALAVFVKRFGTDNNAVIAVSGTGGTNYTAGFSVDFTDNSVALKYETGGSGLASLLGVDELADGVLRIRFTYENTNANTTMRAICYPGSEVATGVGSVYIGGFQYQLNSTFVAEYIPTTTAPVTVGAAYDLLPVLNNIPGSGDESTVEVEFTYYGPTGGNDYLYRCAATSGISYIYIDSTSTIRAAHDSTERNLGTVSSGDAVSIKMATDGVNSWFSVDGVVVSTVSAAGTFSPDTTGNIGIGSRESGVNQANAAIKHFKIRDVALTADEMRIG